MLYAPGTAPDYVMEGSASGRFTFAPLSINGDYAVLLPGDFNGDGADDLVLFNPGTGFDELMLGGSAPGAVLTPGPQTVIDEDYVSAVVGNFGNDGADAILFVAPPTFGSALWYGLRHTTHLAFSTFGAVAVDPSTGRVFVTSGPSGTDMAVLDSVGDLTNTMFTLDGPSGVAFGPSTIFVAMAGGHEIDEFDRTTLAPTGTIDTGATRAAPASLSYQNGKLWFTFWSGGSVGEQGGLGEWDPTSNTVSTVATDVTDEPQLASGTASTDTLIVYGAAVESNWPMARYDLSTGSAVLAQFQGGGPGDCVDVTLSPDQAHIEVACGDAVSEFDSSTLQLDGTQYRTDNVPPNALAATAMHGGVLVSDAEQFLRTMCTSTGLVAARCACTSSTMMTTSSKAAPTQAESRCRPMDTASTTSPSRTPSSGGRRVRPWSVCSACRNRFRRPSSRSSARPSRGSIASIAAGCRRSRSSARRRA